MTRDPVTVRPDVTVASLLDDDVLRNRVSAFPVVDDDHRPVGLVTLNRFRALDAEQRRATYVSDIACAPAEIARMIEIAEVWQGGTRGPGVGGISDLRP